MQVPVREREKLLKKEGLDPTRLSNLTLVYKVQEVRSHSLGTACLFSALLSRLPSILEGSSVWHRPYASCKECLQEAYKACIQ